VVVADDEVVQRRRDGPHLKRTWWTEESIGTASGLRISIVPLNSEPGLNPKPVIGRGLCNLGHRAVKQ